MTNFKAPVLAALMLAAFGISAATASAEETSLPSILLLPGVENVEFKGESATAKTKFTGIQNLEGEGWQISLQGANMAELGQGHLIYPKVSLGAKKCHSPGEPAGTVVVNDEWHIILVLAGPLTVAGIDNLLPAAGTKIECEGVTITVKGSQLVKIEPFGSEIATTGSLKGETGACTGSTPAFTEGDSMPSGMFTAELKSTVGGISAKSCDEIEGSITLKPTQAVELMLP